MSIGILTSGDLGFKVISDLIKQIGEPAFIASNGKSEGIIELSQKNKIPTFIGNPREGRLIQFFGQNNINVDLVLSINYLYLLDKGLINYLPLAINVHGSLLPHYRGRTPHVWAIINGESMAGVTAHVIDADCDTGDIIRQVNVPIEKDDTGASILKKYEKIYPKLLLSVVDDVRSGELIRTPQDNAKATYFGKRTPNDGLINWNWHKERIRNWVRAQSFPYPGAYCLLHGEKVIIDEVKYSDIGFNDLTENGTILVFEENPIVKCPNGALEITIVRNKEILKNIKTEVVLNK